MRIPDLPWSNPLSVRLQNGTYHLFKSPYDALDFLENEWPLRHGRKYNQAVRLCRSALDGTTPMAIGREAFIAACLEAGLDVAAPPPSGYLPQPKRAAAQRS